MMYVPGNLSGWSTVREEFPGLLCEVGHGKVSSAQGQHPGGGLRESLGKVAHCKQRGSGITEWSRV